MEASLSNKIKNLPTWSLRLGRSWRVLGQVHFPSPCTWSRRCSTPGSRLWSPCRKPSQTNVNQSNIALAMAQNQDKMMPLLNPLIWWKEDKINAFKENWKVEAPSSDLVRAVEQKLEVIYFWIMSNLLLSFLCKFPKVRNLEQDSSAEVWSYIYLLQQWPRTKTQAINQMSVRICKYKHYTTVKYENQRYWN